MILPRASGVFSTCRGGSEADADEGPRGRPGSTEIAIPASVVAAMRCHGRAGVRRSRPRSAHAPCMQSTGGTARLPWPTILVWTGLRNADLRLRVGWSRVSRLRPSNSGWRGRSLGSVTRPSASPFASPGTGVRWGGGAGVPVRLDCPRVGYDSPKSIVWHRELRALAAMVGK